MKVLFKLGLYLLLFGVMGLAWSQNLPTDLPTLPPSDINASQLNQTQMTLLETPVVSAISQSSSHFKDWYLAGVTASNEKIWDESLMYFKGALSMAQTDQDKLSTEKWIQYVNKKMGITSSNTSEQIYAEYYEKKVRSKLDQITATLQARQNVSDSGLPHVLLKEGGYSSKSKIQIFKSTLTLTDNSTGDIAIDAVFYIFATRGRKPCVEKIKVVLDNERRDVTAVNLFEFAPTLFYFEDNEGNGEGLKNALGFCSLESYVLSKNLFQFPPKEYFVGFGKKVAYIFHYGEDYAPNGKVGKLSYSDIFDIILNNKPEPGKIDFAMSFGKNSDNTKFRLTEFEKIYPTN